MGSQGMGGVTDEMILDRSIQYLMQGNEYIWVHYTVPFIFIHVGGFPYENILNHTWHVVLTYVSSVSEWRGSRNLFKMNSVFLTSIHIRTTP